jgi:HAD superfamily hydrolase (TIGR01490 family)
MLEQRPADFHRPAWRHGDRPTVAFFDVDETLITVKSMFDFLRFWLARRGDDGTSFQRAAGRLHAIAAQGRPRSDVNRAYYQLFAGVPYASLREAGELWYADYRRRPDAFVAATVAALARHREAGDTTALVSGSFRACLDPLARDLGADLVLCTEPVVGEDGRLTGAVVRPMIGHVKAAAVSETLTALGADPAASFGYGDHASDLDMLTRIGRPRVVGHDPVLRARAAEYGWPVLDPAPAAHWSIAVA